jgi:threonyl-tRNA synthetase
MSEIRVTLKDGKEKLLKAGSNALDLALEISGTLAKAVVVAKVNGVIKDLQDPLQDNDNVELLGILAPEAQDVICHSCEHVLAAAVVALFENAQVAMGPKEHTEGFYYDFDIGRPFTDEDLKRIEEKMKDLIREGITFKKRWLKKADAVELFKDLGQSYKQEILDWIEGDEITIYESGNFIDLCRGPHLPNASFIKAFTLFGCSGSYWRADSFRPMLQRISGIAFAKKEALEAYLTRIEEAKKRDHRKIGPKQELFFVSEKFSAWQDKTNTRSEVRATIYVPETSINKTHSGLIIKKIEELLLEIEKLLPSKQLIFRGFSIIPHTKNGQIRSDIRFFLAPRDISARKEIHDYINLQGNHDIELSCHVDAYAHEDIGPGLVMWLPAGGRLRALIEDFSRKRHFKAGYDMVYSPHIAKSDLWRISGHLGFYQDSMFSPMNVDGTEYLLKPMNCPFHVLMYKFKPRSYRDLPLRFAEFGTVYRYEMAGVLHGLMRVRGFTQDDAHIFCRWDQLDDELDKVLAFVLDMLKAFGFDDFLLEISTRPSAYVGEEPSWDRAESSLKNAINRMGLSYAIDAGGGAFYGPKIDIKLRDCLGRLWQCSTLQLDFNNPERFDLEYINHRSEKVRPVMLHRALFGSLERFIGILIEHYAGNFPAWLSPVQVRCITVSDRHNAYARGIKEELLALGIRVIFDESNDTLGSKIRLAQLDKVPMMIIIGDKEVANEGGTLRLRSQEDKGFHKKIDLYRLVVELCKEPG